LNNRKIAGIAALFVAAQPFTWALAANAPSLRAISDRSFEVTTPLNSNQIITLQNHIKVTDISFDDFNFDGYIDLKIVRSGGNVEKFYDVYLFDLNTKSYVFNQEISAIPCPATDQKLREVIAECFHASACENWTERYSIDRHNHLHLLVREGSYCNPATGEGYHYIDTFRNGKRTSSKVNSLSKGQ
jgi:hypothetical protein